MEKASPTDIIEVSNAKDIHPQLESNSLLLQKDVDLKSKNPANSEIEQDFNKSIEQLAQRFVCLIPQVDSERDTSRKELEEFSLDLIVNYISKQTSASLDAEPTDCRNKATEVNFQAISKFTNILVQYINQFIQKLIPSDDKEQAGPENGFKINLLDEIYNHRKSQNSISEQEKSSNLDEAQKATISYFICIIFDKIIQMFPNNLQNLSGSEASNKENLSSFHNNENPAEIKLELNQPIVNESSNNYNIRNKIILSEDSEDEIKQIKKEEPKIIAASQNLDSNIQMFNHINESNKQLSHETLDDEVYNNTRTGNRYSIDFKTQSFGQFKLKSEDLSSPNKLNNADMTFNPYHKVVNEKPSNEKIEAKNSDSIVKISAFEDLK